MLFGSQQDPNSDNEIHRVNKIGNKRCTTKRNLMELITESIPFEVSSCMFICPSCENEYGNQEEENCSSSFQQVSSSVQEDTK